MLNLYAGDELGAFGYVEKPWYLPGQRQAALLAELQRRGIEVAFHEAPPATDDELALFHTAAHVATVTARCATNQGSLDRAPESVNARSRTLLEAIAAFEGSWVPAWGLAEVLTELDAALSAFAPFLASEGLVIYDHASDTVQLTRTGASFLGDPTATLGGPTYARAHVERAARFICGAVLEATRRIATGELSTVFVPIAGFHHAHRDEARMYCLYNDAALAVTAALEAVSGSVAYIDIDIHRGDGVYGAFVDNPRVVLADLHQGRAPFVEPGGTRQTEHSGEGAGEGTKRTIAIGSGLDDDAYLTAWEGLEHFVRQAKPAFIIFEAGVDGLASDPMSDQLLTPAVFGEIARRVQSLANESAHGRLLVLGGGGYELKGLAAGWAAVVEGLCE